MERYGLAVSVLGGPENSKLCDVIHLILSWQALMSGGGLVMKRWCGDWCIVMLMTVNDVCDWRGRWSAMIDCKSLLSSVESHRVVLCTMLLFTYRYI